MATKIPIGSAAYLTSFVDGQGVGAANYFTYAADHDTNYLLLRQTVNQMIDEISAVSGPNAIAAMDLVLWDDDANPIPPGEQNYGVVGAASYEVSIEGGGATLKCRKGQAFINGQRVTLVSDQTGIAGFGGSATLYIEIDANGAVYIEDTPGNRALDIASIPYNGSIFTGPVTHLADVFFDGDSWAYVRDREATPNAATFGAYTFREGANRIRAIERKLAGQAIGEEGESNAGPVVFLPGTAPAPSLVFGDGSTTIDSDSGWYRASSGRWGFSSGGVLRYTLGPNGLLCGYLGTASLPTLRTANAGFYFVTTEEPAVAARGDLAMKWRSDTVAAPQALAADGVVADPGLAFIGEENTGFYRPGAAQLAIALAGVQRALFDANQLRLPDGAAGTPAFGFLSEAGVGMYRAGTDRLGFATADQAVGEFDAAGNLDLPTNFGAIIRRAAAQTAIASATPTQIAWDTEDRDIGGWIAVTGTDLVVPTDGDGLYLITLEWVWDNIATPVGTRDGWIEAAGTAYGKKVYDAWVDRDHPNSTSTIVALSATDVVRGVVEQSQAAPLDLLSARIAIQKIA